MSEALHILHISAWDNVGGSARSAFRLHQGLERLGVQSRMLVGWKSPEADGDVALVGAHKLWVLDRLCDKVTERLSLQYAFYPSSFALPRRRWVREADVIQLYNTHGGYFSHTALPRLSRFRPVVWRLSDMWPMTGHCAYSFDCERWKTGCGHCPILSDYPALRRDRTALLWRIKQRVYRRADLTLVAPSQWMAGLVKQSPLLQRFPVSVIPNGLDTELFRPIDKRAAREVLGIDPQKQVILFSSHFVTDPRKGGSLLTDALNRVSRAPSSALALVVMGRRSEQWPGPSQVPVTHLGPIQDDRLLATVYSAADVCVLPTLADNSPNGALESLACGTPVVSFDVGGVPELVRHLETGYLARPTDAGDFAQGIQRVLDDAELRTRLGRQGRAMVEREHTLELQAKRFLSLYHDVLQQRREAGDRLKETSRLQVQASATMGEGAWPKVSVVTPSFNQAPFLEATIRSVLEQPYPNIEYLVVDGGSTDGSVEVIRRYADRLAYWVSEPDQGQADAINNGWRRATGEILAYLNSDDLYLPNAVRRAVDFFTHHPDADLVYGALQIVDEHGQPLGKPVEVPASMSVDWLLRYPLPQPTMFVRRRVVERLGFFDPSLHYVFDWDFCLRAAMAGIRMGRLPGPPVAAFRSWAGQKTHNGFERHIDEQLRMRDRLLSKPDMPRDLVNRIAFSKAWAFLWPAYQYYVRGDMPTARRLLHRAVGVHRRIAAHPAFVGLYTRTLLGREITQLARRAKAQLLGGGRDNRP